MRKERISRQRAQGIWDSIRKVANLPNIDMTALFDGKKSANVNDILQKIVPIISKEK